jgi:hypothetical protein
MVMSLRTSVKIVGSTQKPRSNCGPAGTPIFHVASSSGKFQGTMAPHTPTGS